MRKRRTLVSAVALNDTEPRQAAIEQRGDRAPLPGDAVECRTHDTGCIDRLGASGEIDGEVVAAAVVILDGQGIQLGVVEHIARARLARSEEQALERHQQAERVR